MLAGLLLLLLPLTALRSDDEDEQTLTVLAAASLTETFTELAEAFEEEHPGVEVELVFGSSTTLAEQAVDGAPGRRPGHRRREVHDGGRGRQRPDRQPGRLRQQPARRSSRLPTTRPAIDGLDDLDDPAVDYVTCVDDRALWRRRSRRSLESAGIDNPPASEEVDVKAVLARVVQGEADAGLVYRTDAVAAGDDVTEIPTADADALRHQLLRRAAGRRRRRARRPGGRVRHPRAQQRRPGRSSSRRASAESYAE